LPLTNLLGLFNGPSQYLQTAAALRLGVAEPPGLMNIGKMLFNRREGMRDVVMEDADTYQSSRPDPLDFVKPSFW
jgi:hypothetical protein